MSKKPYRIIASRGFLTVFCNGSQIMLQFAGNMGANMESVRTEFESMYGQGSWAGIQSAILEMSGHPDYLWTAYLERDLFLDMLTSRIAVA